MGKDYPAEAKNKLTEIEAIIQNEFPDRFKFKIEPCGVSGFDDGWPYAAWELTIKYKGFFGKPVMSALRGYQSLLWCCSQNLNFSKILSAEPKYLRTFCFTLPCSSRFPSTR